MPKRLGYTSREVLAILNRTAITYGHGTEAAPCIECPYTPSRHCCYFDVDAASVRQTPRDNDTKRGLDTGGGEWERVGRPTRISVLLEDRSAILERGER